MLPPRPFRACRDWRNFPVGIAVDTDRFWVFGTSFIACATHAAVDKSIREKPEKGTPAEVDWALYMPSLLSYDPSKRVYMGLRDLWACDDGTLTAVIEEDQTRDGRIFTAAPQFEGGKLVIEEVVDENLQGLDKRSGWGHQRASGSQTAHLLLADIRGTRERVERGRDRGSPPAAYMRLRVVPATDRVKPGRPGARHTDIPSQLTVFIAANKKCYAPKS